MQTSNKTNLFNFTLAKLRQHLKASGHKPFHAMQIFRWIYKDYCIDFSKMMNLSKDLRENLTQHYTLNLLPIKTFSESDEETQKYLFELDDGRTIESVLIPEPKRLTLCVSSQAGCKMNCSFCATGAIGFMRNLSAHEIVGQVYTINHARQQKGQRTITNVVFMGMGEPLDNIDALIDAVHILVEPQGLDMSQRKITISTCGIIPHFSTLADKTGARLAVSLHSPIDEVRDTLVPINRKYGISALIAACDSYTETTKKHVTFEYTLIDNINDRREDAEALARLLANKPHKVNLIPYNPHPHADYKRPSNNRVHFFRDFLVARDIRTMIRTTRGDDIAAACGQLSSDYEAKRKIKTTHTIRH